MSLKPEPFRAWIETAPGLPTRLVVRGVLRTTTAGWRMRLTRAAPQGFNPAYLILDLKRIAPHGMAAQVISYVEARYEEAPPALRYTHVTIRDVVVGDVTVPVGARRQP